MEKEIREDQIYFIEKIKPFIHPSLTQKTLEQKAESFKIGELIKRIERIERILEDKEVQQQSVRKSRVKEQIISLLEQHKKLTSEQLGKLIGLSRTRCNEYFRELTKEGLTEGLIIDRKKYYKLVKK